MSSKEQNKANITKRVMQRNWGQLKQININDIIDEMIEEDLISIEKSKEFKEKETQSQQTDALLYEVTCKPQQYLDTFFKILANNGYDYIVQMLRDDAAEAASEVTYRDHSDALQQETEKSSESAMQQSEMEGKLARRVMEHIDKHQSQLTEEQTQTLMMQMEKQQLEMAEKQTQVLKEQFEKQQLEMAEKQTQVLKEQFEKQQLEMAKYHTQISKKQEDMEKQFSKMNQKVNDHKECENNIKHLESRIRTLEKTLLHQERAKLNNDVTNAETKKRNLLEEERDQLQYELTRARKAYSVMFNEMEKEILTLKTSYNRVDTCDNCHRILNQEHSDRGQAYRSSLPSRNPYRNPMPSQRAKKVEGVPKKRK